MGFYRLYVQDQWQNTVQFHHFPNSLDHNDFIEKFKKNYEFHFFILPNRRPVVDPHRDEPVMASGGILGRLKAALVRVSHAVEAWFYERLVRDVTLSPTWCRRTATGGSKQESVETNPQTRIEWIHGGGGLESLGGLDFAPMEQADPGPEVTNQQANGADKADGNEPNPREIKRM